MRPVLRDVLRKAGFTFLVVLFAGALVFLGFIYPHPAPVILMYHSITPDTHNNIGLPEGVFKPTAFYPGMAKIVRLAARVKGSRKACLFRMDGWRLPLMTG
jgi:H+/gluconate symporter-like permease